MSLTHRPAPPVSPNPTPVPPSATTQQVQVVTPTVEIKTVTFLNGSPVEAYTTDQLVEIVRNLEERKSELAGIKAKSTKVTSMIKELDANTEQVVAFIDERN